MLSLPHLCAELLRAGPAQFPLPLLQPGGPSLPPWLQPVTDAQKFLPLAAGSASASGRPLAVQFLCVPYATVEGRRFGGGGVRPNIPQAWPPPDCMHGFDTQLHEGLARLAVGASLPCKSETVKWER